MRKIIIAAFISLDGVMQAPGGPEEDPAGGFRHGGWQAALWDDEAGGAIEDNFATPFDLLLGRRTYDIFAAHWPYTITDPTAPDYDEGEASIATRFDAATKYVVTHRPDTLKWANSQALGPDIVEALRALKQGSGPNILVQGSTEIIHLLHENDLADEWRLLVYPLVLGRGKRIFGTGSLPRTLNLVSSHATAKGTIIVRYERAGDVLTGSFARETSSAAEIERRAAFAKE